MSYLEVKIDPKNVNNFNEFSFQSLPGFSYSDDQCKENSHGNLFKREKLAATESWIRRVLFHCIDFQQGPKEVFTTNVSFELWELK